jgi:hypothetical protein
MADTVPLITLLGGSPKRFPICEIQTGRPQWTQYDTIRF